MNADEELLYGYIQEAGREGIWSKFLKQKSNMHATTMTKCLKTLEQKRYIKVIQSVKVSETPPAAGNAKAIMRSHQHKVQGVLGLVTSLWARGCMADRGGPRGADILT